MITDAVLGFVTVVAGFFTSLLPSGHLSLPSAGPITSTLAKLDSLLPIAGVMQLAIGVLAAVVAFVTLRLVLVLWNLIWP